MKIQLINKWYKTLGFRYPKMLSFRYLAVDYLSSILDDFVEAGLADTQFEQQILLETGNYYEQRLSEVLVYDFLRLNGFSLTSEDEGPDFRAEKNGEVYWFEVVTPSANDHINEILEDNYLRLFPDANKSRYIQEQKLIRITSAIAEKNKKFSSYIESGLVKPDEHCIIVVNDTLLCSNSSNMYGLTEQLPKGISGLPLTVEALMGVGYSYWHTEDGKKHELVRTTRDEISKVNGAKIDVSQFTVGKYENISAVLGLTLREDYGFCKSIKTLSAKRGILVPNEHCQNEIKPEVMNTYLADKSYVTTITAPSGNYVNHGTKTIAGQYLDFHSYMIKLYPNLQENKFLWIDFI